MGLEEKEIQKLDLFVLLDDFLREARRLWLLALVLVTVCAAGLTGVRYAGYRPVYEASVSVSVASRLPSAKQESTLACKKRTARKIAKIPILIFFMIHHLEKSYECGNENMNYKDRQPRDGDLSV